MLDDGTASIVGYTGNADNLELPMTLDSHTVTSLGDWAFSGCNSLTTIVIPDSISSVGSNPFESCKALSTIIVSPDHLSLATIDGVLFSKTDKRLITYPQNSISLSYTIPQGIEVIDNGAFSHCSKLTTINIPDSVITIGNAAFTSCSNLTEIVFPDSIVNIGNFLCSDCSNLKKYIYLTLSPALAIGHFLSVQV